MKKRNLLFFALLGLALVPGCNPPQKQELMSIEELKGNWQFRQAGDTAWLPAVVPGTVHTDLMAHGKIEDPYFRMNERQVQWIDKVNWEYRTILTVTPELLARDRVALDFKGLDTYAEVTLNGQPVLSADNMFREWKAEVKSLLKVGDNELHILFRSPIVEGIRKHDALPYVIPVSDNDQAVTGEVEGGRKVSVFTRKAGYHFGWDWGPRLVTSGIWRPVYLEAWDEASITDLHIQQKSLDQQKAVMNASFEIDAQADGPARLTIAHEGMELATVSVDLKKGVNRYDAPFEIANPILWWTNGLGEAHLYNLTGTVAVDGGTASRLVRIGLRTLELVREKDDKGTSFYFKLNGVPVFMKGVNYIPNDMFLPRVTPDNYRKVVETARVSHMNMIRIWGGGVYEDNLFYDLCDEAGILVWQDFMFACAMFPGDEEFLENVRQEATDNVKRLRNHPSIGLWCGNNEILSAWYGWGWKRAEEAKSQENADLIWKAYEDIFHKVLPEVVSALDPARSYWASSPSSGMGIPADLVNGDEHYWGVWWGKEPFETYATHMARFMSEYGFQSFPEIATVRKYTTPEDHDIYSEVMKSHQRSSIGNETIEYYMLKEYEKPKDFESFLYVGQVLQAEGIKFGLEGHRRAAPYNMGSLYWQINDVWPVASWSSTDYYQRWKALQYYVKKGFEPLLVSPFREGEALKVAVINDHLSEKNGVLRLRLLDFEGREVRKVENEVTVPANASTVLFSENLNEFLGGAHPEECFLVTELIEGDEISSSNLLYFKPFKELKLPEPAVTITTEKTAEGYDILLTTDKLARNVYLQCGDEEGFFSDNYFDMLPSSTVRVTLKSSMSPEKLKEALTVRTLTTAFR